jgi:hypothetical protein
MNVRYAFILIPAVTLISSAANTLAEIRKLYPNIAADEKSCQAIIGKVEKIPQKTPVLLGYKACATMAMANHTINPISKLRYFNEGKTELEKLISANKGNYELRYLRLTVQSNAPAFLNYSGNVKSDKEFLKSGIANMKDLELKKMIEDYLKRVI